MASPSELSKTGLKHCVGQFFNTQISWIKNIFFRVGCFVHGVLHDIIGHRCQLGPCGTKSEQRAAVVVVVVVLATEGWRRDKKVK